VAEMNAEARRLGAYDTLVQTPSGLDGWQQLTSAYDLSLVLRVAVNMPRFLAYDQLPSATYPPKKSSAGSVGVYQFDNQSNDFLQGVPGALLAKTGYTDAALHTYAAATSRNGRRLGVIFLRNQRTPLDQWQQAAALFDWGYKLPAGTPAVGTLVAPAAGSPQLATTAPAPALTAGPQTSGSPGVNEAAPLLGTTPAPALAAERSTRNGSGIRDGLLALVLVLVGVAALRLRRRRAQRRRRSGPRPTSAATPKEPAGPARRR
jgi:D-alanyl-D-alanine carboxypeptidase (penicillin-binding protein 5/6)